jgi:hypothetical protein
MRLLWLVGPSAQKKLTEFQSTGSLNHVSRDQHTARYGSRLESYAAIPSSPETRRM